ncbi:MAG: protein kinase [Candidatus Zixiibacteriota bacterium]
MPDSSEGHSLQARKPLPADTMLGRYRIVRLVGAGGMGEVYEAEDTELGRNVAIKLLGSSVPPDDHIRRRFQQEARIAASLNHPNIVTVHDVGEYQGRPFFAMEFLSGESLRDRFKSGPLPIDNATDILIQLCHGLAEAHDAGLVHRDLKPSNIMIGDEGQVKILDFGLAAARVSSRDSGESGSGTIYYMAPEQLKEESVTPASDLFALGVVLYEMLTGRRPFEGEYEASVVYSIVNDDPVPPEKHRADIPEHLVSIVKRLLKKDPTARYPGVNAILTELGETQRQPAAPIAMSRVRRLTPWLAVVLLAAITAVSLIPWTGLDQNRSSRRMLAVLPFENLGSPEDEYFADGVVDAVTTHLARIGGLGVISRTSSMEYRASGKSLPQVGSELGCRWLITGTVHWDRNSTPSRVRVHASLVDVASDTHIWANSYERVLGDIFALQSEIASDIASELQLVMRDSDLQALAMRPTDNLDAYDFYLRGNQYFNRSWEESDIEIAVGLYERAIEQDPEFALAYAMLARGHESMYWEYYDHTDNRKLLARRAADRALELERNLLEGHLALGYYYYHCEIDYVRALEQFQLAALRWPNNAELHSAIAAVQRRIGPIELALVNFLKAAELDPRSHLKLFDVGLTYGLMRKYRQAEVYLDRVIALAPDWPLAHVYKAWLEIFRDGDVTAARAILARGAKRADLARSHYYWWLSRVIEPDPLTVLDNMKLGSDTAIYYLHRAEMFRLLGKHDNETRCADSARAMLEDRVRLYPDNARFHSYLSLAYTGLRQRESAFDHGRRALELLPTTRDAFDALFFALNFAQTCVVFEEYDKAIDQLQFLLSIPGFVSPSYLQFDPLWRPLHNHPRWKELIKAAQS